MTDNNVRHVDFKNKKTSDIGPWELPRIDKTGIPDIDSHPALHCYMYVGHDMEETIRDGSYIFVDTSKWDRISGELYLFKYFPFPENPEIYFHRVRRLGEGENGCGYLLIPDNPETNSIKIDSIDLLNRMMVGRVIGVIVNLELRGDYEYVNV